MQRFVSVMLALVGVMTAGASAAAQPSPDPVAVSDFWTGGAEAYRRAWCAVERYHPGPAIPEWVDCDAYVLSLDEARNFYLHAVSAPNANTHRRVCWAWRHPDASWRQLRKWWKRDAEQDRRFADSLSRVRWPAELETDIARLVRARMDSYAWGTDVSRASTSTAAVLSGDFERYRKADAKGRAAAFAVRATLDLEAPPTFRGNKRSCRGVR
jgi:hypothetical protein